jgi:catechol 2,3-dioxygenase-like lactoylglutathione lyase family enzyme
VTSSTDQKEAMEPQIDVITLAVDDLDRSLAFYRDGLGLETRGVVATEFVDEDQRSWRDRDIPPPRRPRACALPPQRTR